MVIQNTNNNNNIENTDSPLITIVTPVYNHSQYINGYIDSVLNQSYRNIELIIIDDASTDDSVSIIKK